MIGSVGGPFAAGHGCILGGRVLGERLVSSKCARLLLC